jgi:hypothetical protein
MPSARLVRTTTSNVCPVAVTRTVIFSASIRCSAWRPNDQVDRRIATDARQVEATNWRFRLNTGLDIGLDKET